MTTTYRVELELFAGPMDLLLYLVRRNELSVLDVQISKVATQFLEFLEVLEFLDLDLVGEFLVMAATLLEIKSREALPQEPEAVEPDAVPLPDDPRSGLIERLIAYRRYKDAAQAIEERAAAWQDRFPRLTDERPRAGKDPSADFIREVELWDLVSALSRIIRRNHVERETRIRYDDTPIHVYVAQIGEQVRREGRVAFTSLFDGETLRSRIVGMFLAVLELLRHHSFRAEQTVDFGEIWILPPLPRAELAAHVPEPERTEPAEPETER